MKVGSLTGDRNDHRRHTQLMELLFLLRIFRGKAEFGLRVRGREMNEGEGGLPRVYPACMCRPKGGLKRGQHHITRNSGCQSQEEHSPKNFSSCKFFFCVCDYDILFCKNTKVLVAIL